MKLILCHSDDNWANKIIAQLSKDIEIESYNEFYKRERTKAFRVKGGFGARATPFALFYYNDKIKPFYSETLDCTEENIINFIKSINND